IWPTPWPISIPFTGGSEVAAAATFVGPRRYPGKVQMKRLPIDGFLLALALAVVAAFLWPELGAKHGHLRLDLVTSYGVAVVFLLYGLNLAPEKMREGLSRWKVHLIVVATTFVLFPAVVLGAESFTASLFPLPVLIGFFYVAALPSTVSSAVAMTSMA